MTSIEVEGVRITVADDPLGAARLALRRGFFYAPNTYFLTLASFACLAMATSCSLGSRMFPLGALFGGPSAPACQPRPRARAGVKAVLMMCIMAVFSES
jgi:hypothetical protein